MTARQDILRAGARLTRRGATPFTLQEIVAECLAKGSTYPVSTLRSTLISQLSVDHDAPGITDEPFLRVAVGTYVLAPTPKPTPKPKSNPNREAPPRPRPLGS